jgi:hypothetical protein
MNKARFVIVAVCPGAKDHGHHIWSQEFHTRMAAQLALDLLSRHHGIEARLIEDRISFVRPAINDEDDREA